MKWCVMLCFPKKNCLILHCEEFAQLRHFHFLWIPLSSVWILTNPHYDWNHFSRNACFRINSSSSTNSPTNSLLVHFLPVAWFDFALVVVVVFITRNHFNFVSKLFRKWNVLCNCIKYFNSLCMNIYPSLRFWACAPCRISSPSSWTCSSSLCASAIWL